MSATPWPDHLLSLEEWDARPEDTGRHYELVEGNLLVSPRPVSDHQLALFELGYQLRSQIPAGLKAVPEIEVSLFDTWPPTIRVPDLIVVPTEIARTRPSRYQAADVLLAVEVISPGSRRTDRFVKFGEYADAKIPYYWLVDLDACVTLTAYQLIEGEYEVIAEGGGTLTMSSPVAMTVDLDGLVSHWGTDPNG
jgi:Uma2 family endonuclease